MTRKRGALSTEEENYIKDNIEKIPITDIAIALNRTKKTIEKFCSKKNLTYSGMSEETYDHTLLRARLEERPYWKEVKKQFNDEELEYFTITWIEIMKQFREDILYTEEMQLKQWITLDIMGNKVLQERMKSLDQIVRLEEMLNAEWQVGEELRDVETITRLESELAMLRNSQSAYTTEHTKILDKIEKIQRDLKAARIDRVKKIEDSKTSFSGFLKALDDETLRQEVGEDMEINKMAKDKAIKQLSEYHKYEDGQVDQPFLSTDTLKEDD